MPEPTKPGAVIYVRVSKVGGRDRNASSYQTELEQQERCEAYARARGYGVVAVLSDIDVSGAKWDRKGLDQALRMVEAGDAQAVIVYRLSRLGRGLRGVLSTVERITTAGAALMSVNEGLDLSTAAGRLTFNLLASVDEYERELRGEYWQATRARVEARGVLVGPTPVGLARDDESRVIVDQAVADRMRAVFKARAAGKSFLDCAAMLDEIKPSRSGRPRLAYAASIILRNPIYKGVLPHGGPCEALLTEDEWQAAQLTPQARRSNSRFYLLSGVATCAGCGGPMVGSGRAGADEQAVYQCRNASRPEPERCKAPATIMAGNLERWVTAQTARRSRLDLARREGEDLAVLDGEHRAADAEVSAYLADTQTRALLGDDEWREGLRVRVERRDEARAAAITARDGRGPSFDDVRGEPEALAAYLGGFLRALVVKRGRNLSIEDRVHIEF